MRTERIQQQNLTNYDNAGVPDIYKQQYARDSRDGYGQLLMAPRPTGDMPSFASSIDRFYQKRHAENLQSFDQKNKLLSQQRAIRNSMLETDVAAKKQEIERQKILLAEMRKANKRKSRAAFLNTLGTLGGLAIGAAAFSTPMAPMIGMGAGGSFGSLLGGGLK